jgi:outer membrane protein insertion porin family
MRAESKVMEANRRHGGMLFGILLGVLGGLTPTRAWAAELVVGKVEVRTVGEAAINSSIISSRIKLREGAPFRQELNDDSIRALYATHLFDYVEVITENGVNDRSIDVVYVLHPKRRIGRIGFEGNHHISSRRLRRIIQTGAGSALDRAAVQKDVEAIRELYLGKGYADVEVAAEFSDGDSTGNFVYAIQEGPRLPIGAIHFSGNNSLSSKELRRRMGLRRRHFFSFFSGSGYYRPRQLDEDLEALRNHYRNCGFLDVQIRREDVTFERQNGLTVGIAVEEGPRFRVGAVTFSGNELYDGKRLEKLLKLHSGTHFSPADVDRSVDALHRFYGQMGYIDTQIAAQRRANVSDNSIDLTFAVREAPMSRVGIVKVQGNAKTKNSVILRELSLYPGDKFDLIKLRNSENRLRETRYFDQVSLVPEGTAEPNVRNITISVEEAKTGKFYIGGAASSIDNIVGFIEFSQSNFDITNRRTHFQGAGQKFRSRVEVGTRLSQLQISFEEPWLCARELAFGTDVFISRSEYKKSDQNYAGSSYNERHLGFESSFRKRIVELLEGRSYYRLDRTRISDVESNAPITLHEEEELGSRWISKAGLSLQRDSRDSLLYPTVGNRVELETAYAGLGGDVHYLNFDLQAGQWFKLTNCHTQTFSIIAKAGTIKSFRGEAVPYFDRKFLGGPADMRGFESRAVGPRDPYGEPLGAMTYAYGCAEYSFKVTEIFRTVLFGEAAHSGSRFMGLNNPLYVDAGLELRLFIMGSPLRLIFGYPIHGDPYHRAHHLQFNFSFGTIF